MPVSNVTLQSKIWCSSRVALAITAPPSPVHTLARSSLVITLLLTSCQNTKEKYEILIKFNSNAPKMGCCDHV
ncbi:50S ribosomal protein L14, chloroplastic [Frankliniella fusca]|uniref:50S ribosomal protein L14, chloroplastic n=1 Tax=Frankliniella fusca TaxID=407009 RepID=A0AAE1H535_9NEOP|nr:50S ribosomal protein L14, chloroplastic [Frankliniella fusca]